MFYPAFNDSSDVPCLSLCLHEPDLNKFKTCQMLRLIEASTTSKAHSACNRGIQNRMQRASLIIDIKKWSVVCSDTGGIGEQTSLTFVSVYF